MYAGILPSQSSQHQRSLFLAQRAVSVETGVQGGKEETQEGTGRRGEGLGLELRPWDSQPDLHIPSSTLDRESDGGPGGTSHSFIHSTNVGWTELLMAQHWDSYIIA